MTSIARKGTGTRANLQDMFIIIIIIILLGSEGFWNRFPLTVSSLYMYLALLPGMSYRIVANGGGVMPHTKKQVILRVLRHADPALFKTVRGLLSFSFSFFFFFDAQAARFAN